MADDNINKPYASTFKTKKIALWKVGEETGKPYVNLVGMVTHFKYYEDIFMPTYSATMLVVDNAENLISSMPIQGFEKVVVEFEDATNTSYEYEFRVWTIGNRITKDRRQIYTLGLISAEALINEGIRINTVVKGNTSDQVKKILREKLNVTDAKMDIEASATSFKMIPTKKTPFALIRSLQSKTLSEKAATPSKPKKLPVIPFGSKSTAAQSNIAITSDVGTGNVQKAKGTAGYLFFQTRKGFVFRSIDSLASTDSEQNGRPSVGKTYYWQYGKTGDDSLYKIQEIIFGKEIDIMQKMRDGAFCSIVCYFNINTGKYEEHVYKLADVWNDMVHMGSQTKLPSGQTKLAEYPSRVMSTIINHENWYMDSGVASNEPGDGSDKPSEFPDFQKNSISQSISRMGIMFNQQLTISLTGHLELVAGDKIEIRIPNQVTDKDREKETWDPEHSGTYLIAKLNHQFDIPNQTVYTVLNLIRDSYGIKEKESKVK